MNIDYYKPAIQTLAEKHDLDFVVLFGSQATGRTHAESDVDIGVISHVEVDRLLLMNEMDKIFGRNDVTVVDLSEASPTLMYAIIEDGKLLYEKNESVFLEWKIYAIKVWMETKWLRDLGEKKMLDLVAQYA